MLPEMASRDGYPLTQYILIKGYPETFPKKERCNSSAFSNLVKTEVSIFSCSHAGCKTLPGRKFPTFEQMLGS